MFKYTPLLHFVLFGLLCSTVNKIPDVTLPEYINLLPALAFPVFALLLFRTVATIPYNAKDLCIGTIRKGYFAQVFLGCLSVNAFIYIFKQPLEIFGEHGALILITIAVVSLWLFWGTVDALGYAYNDLIRKDKVTEVFVVRKIVRGYRLGICTDVVSFSETEYLWATPAATAPLKVGTAYQFTYSRKGRFISDFGIPVNSEV